MIKFPYVEKSGNGTFYIVKWRTVLGAIKTSGYRYIKLTTPPSVYIFVNPKQAILL
jgi:hypothetical protein